MKSWQWPEIETRYPWLEVLVLWPMPSGSHQLHYLVDFTLCNFNRLCCKISDALSMYLQVPKHALYSVSMVIHACHMWIKWLVYMCLWFYYHFSLNSLLYTQAFRERGLGMMLMLYKYKHFQFVKRAHTLAICNDDVMFDANWNDVDYFLIVHILDYSVV